MNSNNPDKDENIKVDLQELPSEMIVKIVENLDALSTSKLSQTNKFFNSLELIYVAKNIKPLKDKLDIVIEIFLKEQNEIRKLSRPEYSHSNSSAELYKLLSDTKDGHIYTALLLKMDNSVLSTGSWANIAKISLKHAEIIFSYPEIVDKLIEDWWMENIADGGREAHAKLILSKYGDRLDDASKDRVKDFSGENRSPGL